MNTIWAVEVGVLQEVEWHDLVDVRLKREGGGVAAVLKRLFRSRMDSFNTIIILL